MIEIVRGAPDEYEIIALVTAIALTVRRRDGDNQRDGFRASSTAAPWSATENYQVPGAWSQAAS